MATIGEAGRSSIETMKVDGSDEVNEVAGGRRGRQDGWMGSDSLDEACIAAAGRQMRVRASYLDS